MSHSSHTPTVTRRRLSTTWRGIAVAATAVALTAACGNSSNPVTGGGGSSNSDKNSIIVGSANFPESEVVADIYINVLKANGFSTSSKLNIGSRETYIPALKDRSIDLVPDYTGNLLRFLDKNSTVTTPDQVNAALTAALGSDLTAYNPSPAADSDTVTVTADTAAKWNLKSIADLAPHSSELTVAAPSEFQTRPVGLPGLKQNYGVDVSSGNFVAISDGGGPATVAALTSGKVLAANIYSTSPAIDANNLKVLDDPKFNFPAQNVIPVVNSQKASDKLAKVLNAISAVLSTQDLKDLNKLISGDSKTEPAAAAEQWVKTKGLDKALA